MKAFQAKYSKLSTEELSIKFIYLSSSKMDHWIIQGELLLVKLEEKYKLALYEQDLKTLSQLRSFVAHNAKFQSMQCKSENNYDFDIMKVLETLENEDVLNQTL